MHKKFTLRKKVFQYALLVLIGLIPGIQNVDAQTPWSGVYGNEWLAGKYSQPWLRIGVGTKGVQRIAISSLPANFQTADKSKLQLWHRGNQVSIIKADNSEILFYGVPNDGSSDALLYRLPVTRTNAYFSNFSDESSYFLTISPTNGDRAVSETLTPSGTPLLYHIKTDVKTYVNEYTHTTVYSTRPSNLNSFFEEGESGTGTLLPLAFPLPNGADAGTIYTENPKPTTYANSYTAEPFSYAVNVPYGSAAKTVTVRLSGRQGNADVEVFAGVNAGSLRSVGSVTTSNFAASTFSFNLADGDFNPGGTVGFKSTVKDNNYSISYITLTYQQQIDMQNLNSYEFTFPATTPGSTSRFTILNPASGAVFYDISNADRPRVISESAADLMITRDNNDLKLLATNQVVNVASGKITTANFQDITPSQFDYLILTNPTLATSAATYSNYRANVSPGKKYKPILKQIRDIYDEFNYGEPSPVAIRRFVDYMISDGNKNKHLLIIGKSITRPDRVVKELPDEVPTVGFPGSDVLLVDGLGGVQDDVPAIPVGRISAISNQQVLDYLAKLTTYEAQTDVSWRKNVIHISGGKTDEEITQFSGYLSGIASLVTSAGYGGNVITKVKTIVSETAIEQITIAPELNGSTVPNVTGAGMVTYFGHGSVFRTDLNAGYASDPAKGYANANKYPIMFYNGCGVGNIFGDNSAETVNTSASRPISLDWLLAANKGAVAVFGNDWDAYAIPSNEFLDRLYPLIYSKTDKQRGTLGQILQQVALDTKVLKGYTYNVTQNSGPNSNYDVDRANIHQMLLQGDPALVILRTESPLPVDLISFQAKLSAPNKVDVLWKTASETNNGYFQVERSYNAKKFESIGQIEGKGNTTVESSYTFYDNDPLPGISYYRLKQVDRPTTTDGKAVDGAVTYSQIVSVKRDDSSLLIVSPNPVVDFVEIKINASTQVKSWNLINIQGKIIKKNRTELKADFSNIAPGEYIIEIVSVDGDIFRRKIVKQ